MTSSWRIRGWCRSASAPASAAAFPISSASSRWAHSSGISPATSSLPAGPRAGRPRRRPRAAGGPGRRIARRGRRSQPPRDGRRSRAQRSRRRRSGTRRRGPWRYAPRRRSSTRSAPCAPSPAPATAAGERASGGQRGGEEQRVLLDRPSHRLRRQPARRVAVEVDRLDRHVVAVVADSVQRVEHARQSTGRPRVAGGPTLQVDLRHRDAHRARAAARARTPCDG